LNGLALFIDEELLCSIPNKEEFTTTLSFLQHNPICFLRVYEKVVGKQTKKWYPHL